MRKGNVIVGAYAVLVGIPLGLYVDFLSGNLGALSAVGGVVIFAVLIWLLWNLRRDWVWLVISLYLVTPGPASNLLPSVNVFPLSGSDLYASTEFFVLPDLVLLVAALALLGPGDDDKTTVWRRRPSGEFWFLAAMVAAATSFFLADPRVDSTLSLNIAALWVRLGLVAIVMGRGLRRYGMVRVTDSVVRGIVLGTSVLAVQLLALVLLLPENFALGGYALVDGSRPRLPGWGNNVAANVIVVGLVLLAFAGSRLPLSGRSRLLLAAVHVSALALGGTRLSLIVAAAVGVVLLQAWARGRRAALVIYPSVIAGLLAFPLLFNTFIEFATRINPRFASVQDAIGILSGRVITFDAGGGSFATRGDLWRAAAEMFSTQPIAGLGWGSWGYLYQAHSVVPLEIADPHMGYLYVLAEGGMLAALAIYAPALFAFVRRARCGRLLSWPTAAVAALLLLEIANPNLYRPSYAVVYVSLVMLGLTAAQEPESTTESTSASRQVLVSREPRLF